MKVGDKHLRLVFTSYSIRFVKWLVQEVAKEMAWVSSDGVSLSMQPCDFRSLHDVFLTSCLPLCVVLLLPLQVGCSKLLLKMRLVFLTEKWQYAYFSNGI